MDNNSQDLEQLLYELVHDIRILVEKELELARTEFSHKLRVAKRNLFVAMLGGAVAYGGLLVLIAAAVTGLEYQIPLIWAMVLTGGGTIIIGGWMAWNGFRNIRRQKLCPMQTLEVLRENKKQIKRDIA
jgi:hypothetical protein